MDIEKAVKHLNEHAENEPTGKCARYVRLALQAGGLDLKHHPMSAKDYGPTLLSAGFTKFYEFKEMASGQSAQSAAGAAVPSLEWEFTTPLLHWSALFEQFRGVTKVSQTRSSSNQDYVPKKGDVAVIQPYKGGDPHGHIAMYNGTKWVSDFKQRDMWGGPGYRKHKPTCVVYRP